MGVGPHLKLVCGIIPEIKNDKIVDRRFALAGQRNWQEQIWEQKPVIAPSTFDEHFVVNHFIDRWNLSKVKGAIPRKDDIRYFDEMLHFETSPSPLFGVVFDEAHGDLVWTMAKMFEDAEFGEWGIGFVKECPSTPLEDDSTEYGHRCNMFFKYGYHYGEHDEIEGPCTIWHLPALKRTMGPKKHWVIKYMIEKLRLVQHNQNYTFLGGGFKYNFTITHYLMSQIGWTGLTKYDYRMYLSLTWS